MNYLIVVRPTLKLSPIIKYYTYIKNPYKKSFTTILYPSLTTVLLEKPPPRINSEKNKMTYNYYILYF